MKQLREPRWLDDDEDLSDEELAYFRARLTRERDELVERLRAHRGELPDLSDRHGDSVDLAAEMGAFNVSVERIEVDERQLREIEDALRRLDDDTFGLCLGNEEMISRRRLRARPWVRYSLEHQEELEDEARRRPVRRGFEF